MRDSASPDQGKTFQPTTNSTTPAKVVFFPPSSKKDKEPSALFSFDSGSEAGKTKPKSTPAGAVDWLFRAPFKESTGLKSEGKEPANKSLSSPAAGKPASMFGMPIDKPSGEKSL